MSQNPLVELLRQHLGDKVDQYNLHALASEARDELGELTDLAQADPDALADIIRRHEFRAPSWYAPPTS